MNLQKIQKRAKFFALIFQFLFFLFVFLTVIALILLVFFHYPLTFDIKKSSENFGLFFNYSQTFDSTSETMLRNLSLARLILYNSLLIIIFYQTKQLFKKISYGLPVFDSKIIQQLNNIAFWLYVYALAPMIIDPIISYIFTRSFEIRIGIDASLLFAIGVSLLIEVFKYGAVLQYEVDETV
ncbi:hypothetical protein DOK78_002724 [Enterococcus sp. DIV2402]|uniref:DUF2975 domain-containing protein n=1 Tax=Candidatus Enterococcus lowellii TaxID=2230877 RepID=A0ABZ2SQM1_9ENTE|nr:hypothetical protein [Enterococcus sp. DIV2402]